MYSCNYEKNKYSKFYQKIVWKLILHTSTCSGHVSVYVCGFADASCNCMRSIAYIA